MLRVEPQISHVQGKYSPLSGPPFPPAGPGKETRTWWEAKEAFAIGGGVAEKQGQVNIRTLFCTPLYPFLGHSHPREGGPQTWGLSSADVPKRSLERSSQSCPAKKRGDTGSSFLQSVPEVFEDSHQDRISFPSLFSRALLPHHRRVIAVEMGHRPRIVVLGALQFIHWQLSYGSQPHCPPSLAPQKPLPQRKLFKTGLSRLYLEPMEPEAQACNLPLQPCTPLASEEYGFLVFFSSHKAQCSGAILALSVLRSD